MVEVIYIKERSAYLGRAVVVSVVIHLLLCALLFGSYPRSLPVPIEVTYVQLVPPAEPNTATKQIVTPPERTIDSTPRPTNLLTDRDTFAEKDQIKRGDDPNAGPQKATRQERQQPAPEQHARKEVKEQKAKEPKEEKPQEKTKPLKQLSLDARTLDEKFGGSAPTPEPQAPTRAVNLSGYRPFSRPAGSGASIFGIRGSNDYMPNLPDGDVTLLNAKAERFAVFVRRVAVQVFSNLRSSGWEVLSPSDIRLINNYTTVTAVLSPTGKLLSVRLQGTSGSTHFDKVLEQAVQHGAEDPNPPPGALASDGNIHFVFKAKSWNDAATNQRTGAAFERRWLFLATGLE